MKKHFITLLVAFVLSACGNNSQPVPQAENTPPPQSQPATIYFPADKVPATARFAVASYGSFYGGYDNHTREMFVITDTRTGHQYLAVTGCGTTELWTETSTSFDGEGHPKTTSTTVEE